MRSIDKVLAALDNPRPGNGGWMGKCPGHDDHTPSLSIKEGEDGKTLLKCFAGCTVEAIVAAVGLTMRDLMPDNRERTSQPPRAKKQPTFHPTVEAAEASALWSTRQKKGSDWKIANRYVYLDAKGAELMRVLRFEPQGGGDKEFRPISPREGGWVNLDPVGLLPLYQLPEVVAVQRVFFFEGEKCVETARALGFVATTSSHGANSAAKTDWSPLAGREVMLFPDNDDPGRAYAASVSKTLLALDPPARVRVVALPDLPQHGDVVDFIAARRKAVLDDAQIKSEIDALVQGAEFIEHVGGEGGTHAADHSSFTSSISSAPKSSAHGAPWPQPVASAALLGIAGEFVHLVAPHTESDEMALLIQLLVGFGSIVGRCPYYQVEAVRHHPSLFALLGGATSKGRKGTSKGQVLNILRLVDAEWEQKCCTSGLSSGEGLIWNIRDPIEGLVREGKGPNAPQVMQVTDPGVPDKRCMVHESEFAQPLRVLQREGNTLSPVIRSAWDGETLGILTKNSPAKATEPHVSIVGHSTKDEIVRYLSATDLCNGFANRFLYVCVRRSKLLPFGGDVPPNQIDDLATRLRLAVAAARSRGRIRFDAAAADRWVVVYTQLSREHPGLVGAAIARAEAQVVRLALIYALLDSADAIGIVHMEAALAVWKYCEDSARYIFGEATGDPMADKILSALREKKGGLDRTAIQKIFNNNKSVEEIEAALQVLRGAGLATCAKHDSGGRPQEVWGATKETKYTKEASSGQGSSNPIGSPAGPAPTKETKETRNPTPAADDLNSFPSSNSSGSPAEDGDGQIVEDL